MSPIPLSLTACFPEICPKGKSEHTRQVYIQLTLLSQSTPSVILPPARTSPVGSFLNIQVRSKSNRLCFPFSVALLRNSCFNQILVVSRDQALSDSLKHSGTIYRRCKKLCKVWSGKTGVDNPSGRLKIQQQ